MFCNNQDNTATANAGTSSGTIPLSPDAKPVSRDIGMQPGGSSSADFWSRILQSKLPPAFQTMLQGGNKPTTTAGMATPQTAVTPMTDPAPAAKKNGNL